VPPSCHARRELLSHLSALRPLAALERLDVVVKTIIAAYDMGWRDENDEDMGAADDLLPLLPPGVKEVRVRVGARQWVSSGPMGVGGGAGMRAMNVAGRRWRVAGRAWGMFRPALRSSVEVAGRQRRARVPFTAERHVRRGPPTSGPVAGACGAHGWAHEAAHVDAKEQMQGAGS
jgi:hypothetical protein